MATKLPDILARVRIDTSAMKSDLSGVSSQGTAAGTSMGKGFTKGFSPAVKGIGASIAGLFAVQKVSAFFGSAVDEARDAQKTTAQTTQVIKTQGNAAHIAAGQVAELSAEISNKVGIDDEVIQSGANMLLTFSNIRNEVGTGNDIFNQATQTATDMSVALGQDVTQSAMQLGKALNDPVKGVGALRRVGVAFTDSQKNTIEKMVKTGDVMGAQKLILAELTKEFGGSAEAQATDAEKTQVAWANAKESLGTSLLPMIDMIARFATKVASTPGAIQGLVIVLGVLAAAWAINTIAAAASAIAMAAAAAPILIIVVAIAALIAIIILCIKHWDAIKNAVTVACSAIKGAVMTVFNWIKDHWPLLLAIMTGPIGLAVLFIVRHFDQIISAVKKIPGKIKDAFSAAGSWLVQAGKDIVMGLIHGIESMFGKLGDVVGSIAGKVKDGVTGLLGIGSPSKVMRDLGQFTGQGFALGLEDSLTQIQAATSAIPSVVAPGASGGQVIDQGQHIAAVNLTIANPAPERASDSLYHTIQKLAVGL